MMSSNSSTTTRPSNEATAAFDLQKVVPPGVGAELILLEA
jgi:hypothetical protein